MFFEKEICYIQTPQIRDLATRCINLIPEYFYRIPASSSGQWHPKYALGTGGLFRHTVAAVGIAQELFRIYTFSQLEKDIITLSLIVHDGWKQGETESGRTVHEHPLIAKEKVESLPIKAESENVWLWLVGRNVSTHMGQWNISPNSEIVLPLPMTEMEKFVHLCDYIASRKCLEYVGEAY